jgi:uncharacterized membrane protein
MTAGTCVAGRAFATVRVEEKRMSLLDALRTVHVTAGATGLLSLWIPLVSAKGGRLHRRVGWVFVIAMAIVSVTALWLCGYRFWVAWPGLNVRATFLGFLGLVTGSSTYKGVRVLRTKDRQVGGRRAVEVALPLLQLATGVATAGLGIVHGMTLLIVAGPLGVLGAWGDLRYWLRAPRGRMQWWYEHMNGMVGSSIAAITAFLVQDAVSGGRHPLVFWLGPTLVGVPLLALWQRYYRRRFDRSRDETTIGGGVAVGA